MLNLKSEFYLIASLTLLVLLLSPAALAAAQSESTHNSKGTDHVLDLLEFKNMDIIDVAKLISQKSGVNIVVGKNVKGRVTIYLKETPMYEALNIIMEAYGWAMARDGDVIKLMTESEYEERYGHKFGRDIETKLIRMSYVSPKDAAEVMNQIKSSDGKVIADNKSNILIIKDTPDKVAEMAELVEQIDLPVRTEVFKLGYADGEEVVAKIEDMLTPGFGSVKFDQRSKKVIVADTYLNIRKIENIIEEFDEQHKEVLIEAKIVQITLNDDLELGVDWEALVNDYQNLTLKSNFDVLGATDKRGELTFGTLASDDYTFLIQALSTVGETEILSSPRIATVSDKEAKILVGSTEPYVTTTTTTPSSGPTTTAESVNFIEVGVKLYVTPTVHDDDFITMNIRPEVSSVVNNVVTGNNNTVPVVETSEAETTVMVKHDVTIVIGGLIKEESIKTIKRVPLLGQIPILGHAFRSTSKDEAKTEIAIFLTPRIITGDADITGGEGEN